MNFFRNISFDLQLINYWSLKKKKKLTVPNERGFFPSVMKKRFRFSSSRDNFPNSFNFQVTGEWHGLTPVLSFHLKHSEPVKMKLHRSRLLTRPRPCTMPYHRTRLSTRTLQGCGRFVVIKWNFFSLSL